MQDCTITPLKADKPQTGSQSGGSTSQKPTSDSFRACLGSASEAIGDPTISMG